MSLSLRARLLLGVLAWAAALLGALALLWTTGTRNNQQLVEQSSQVVLENALTDLEDRGELTLEHLARVLPNLVYYLDFKGLAEALAPLLVRPDVKYVQVFDRQGRIVHDGSRVLQRFGETMDDALAGQVTGATDALVLWTAEHVDVSRPLMLGSERIGGMRIGLSRTGADEIASLEQAELQARLQARFDHQIRWLFVVFGMLLLIATMAGWMMARGVLRPIRALAEATDRLEHGHYEEVNLEVKRDDELGALVKGFNRMARALREHDRNIRRLAYQDALTGMPNRLMFRELLDQAIGDLGTQQECLGLLFIDLDDFKRINDTLGHDAGDHVLGVFAERLQQLIAGSAADRNEDRTTVARLGGDEFVALLSGGSVRERCHTLARAILDSLGEPFDLDGKSLLLSASIGITTFPDDARSSRHLLKCGDLAMYQAKLEGKNGIAWYSDHLTATAEENLNLEQDLRQALQDGQIQVLYQPVVCMRTGRMTGAEALLRWHHPEHGEIAPDKFIEVAESSSLINELGRFVMMRACRDAAAWQDSLPGLRVGVNISARQLLRRGLLPLVEEALLESGLPADCLSLELTESSLLHDRVLTADTLIRLRQRGTHVWLDDFGTGFSGLNHLRQMQVRGVKIDRSFIADILTDPDDLALTSAIIAMTHSIGMRVIAEGVENREQWRLLCERGCDLAQGFLLAPALPAAEIPGYRVDPSLLEWAHSAEPAQGSQKNNF